MIKNVRGSKRNGKAAIDPSLGKRMVDDVPDDRVGEDGKRHGCGEQQAETSRARSQIPRATK